jgi:hypothetical protein
MNFWQRFLWKKKSCCVSFAMSKRPPLPDHGSRSPPLQRAGNKSNSGFFTKKKGLYMASLAVLSIMTIHTIIRSIEVEGETAVDESSEHSWFRINRNIGCRKLKKPRVLCACALGAEQRSADNLASNLKALGSKVRLCSCADGF